MEQDMRERYSQKATLLYFTTLFALGFENSQPTGKWWRLTGAVLSHSKLKEQGLERWLST